MSVEEWKEAVVLFSRTWGASLSRFSTILTFRSVAKFGLPAVTEQVLKESTHIAHELFNDPRYDNLFKDKNGVIELLGGLDRVIEEMTKKKIKIFHYSIDAASLIFAHSILDGVALEYCRTTALASPSSWEGFVSLKQIKLQDIRGSTYDNILRMKIDAHLQALERESLKAKIDRLFAVCHPPAGFAPIDGYGFDGDRLDTLDSNRHEIVHGQGQTNPLPGGDDDIWFLMQTSNYLMLMVNLRYDLKIDPMSTISGFKPN